MPAEIIKWVPSIIVGLGAAVGYGRLRGQVANNKERIGVAEDKQKALRGNGDQSAYSRREECEVVHERIDSRLGSIEKTSRATQRFVLWFLTKKEDMDLAEAEQLIGEDD